MIGAAVDTSPNHWLELDREWRVVRANDDAPAYVSTAVGMNVWEAFVGAEDSFRPMFELAWERGHSAKVVAWNDQLTDVRAFRRGDVLLVTYEPVIMEGLKASLENVARRVGLHLSTEERWSTPSEENGERRLRVVR